MPLDALPSFPPLLTGLSACWGEHNHGPEWGGGSGEHRPTAQEPGEGVRALLMGSQHSSLGKTTKIKFKIIFKKQWWCWIDAEMAGGFLGAHLYIKRRIFSFESPKLGFLIFFFFWHGISWLSLGILVVFFFLFLFLLLFLRWNWNPGGNLIGNIWGFLLNIPGDKKQKFQESRTILKKGGGWVVEPESIFWKPKACFENQEAKIVAKEKNSGKFWSYFHIKQKHKHTELSCGMESGSIKFPCVLISESWGHAGFWCFHLQDAFVFLQFRTLW